MVRRGPARAAPGGHRALEDGAAAGHDGGRGAGGRGAFRNCAKSAGPIIARLAIAIVIVAALDAVDGMLGADGGAHIFSILDFLLLLVARKVGYAKIYQSRLLLLLLFTTFHFWLRAAAAIMMSSKLNIR